MTGYEYDSGLRQTLVNNTAKDLFRLDDLADHKNSTSHKRIRDGLKQFYSTDIMAAYAANPNVNISNDYVGSLFIRGTLDSIDSDENELIFKAPLGIIQPQGITYRGNTWIVPINQLIEVLAVEDYKANPNPYDRQYPLKKFEFGTMFGLNMGEVQAYEPFGAFLKFIDQNEQLRKELSKKKTTPIRLMSIKI
jgi:hypothetical protein